MKVAIVGSRNYPAIQAVAVYIEHGLDPGDVVISGGAVGVDTEAVRLARLSGYEAVVMWADWDRYGHAAGPIRNKRIVRACDRLVAFWDGRSAGTRNAVGLAKASGKPVEVYGPTGEFMHGGIV